MDKPEEITVEKNQKNDFTNMDSPEEITVEKGQKEEVPNKGFFGWIILLIKIIIKTIIFMMAIYGSYNVYQIYRSWQQYRHLD